MNCHESTTVGLHEQYFSVTNYSMIFIKSTNVPIFGTTTESQTSTRSGSFSLNIAKISLSEMCLPLAASPCFVLGVRRLSASQGDFEL